MKLFPWLLLIACLAGAVWFGRGVLENSRRDPRDLLESARARIAAESADLEGARHELDLALTLVSPAEDLGLVQELLAERAGLLRQSGSPDAAAVDLETLLAFEPEDANAVRMELAWVELARERLDLAEAQVAAILEQVPWHSGAHLMQGLCDKQRLEELHAEVLEDLYRWLPTAIAAELEVDIERALLGDLEDPQRSAGTRRLELELERVHPERAGELLLRLDRGSVIAARAREHLIDSLGSYVSPRAVQLLAKDFIDAGRPTYAVDLGLAALVHEQVGDSPVALQAVAEALGRLDRPRAATSIAARAVPDGDQGSAIQPDFMADWCSILYRGEEWQRLRAIANQMAVEFRARPAAVEEREAANFYLGMARYRLGELAAAEQPLLAFANERSTEPEPGALSLVMRTLALVYRAQEDTSQEFRWLLDATRFDPRGSGQAWRRLAELQRDRPGQAWRAMTSYAQAMSVDPQLAPLVEPEWREFGAELLARDGRDIELERQTLLRQARLDPPDGENAFVAVALAEANRDARRLDGVLLITSGLLERYPGLPPAADLRIEALLQLGRERDAAELMLERAEAVPVDPPHLAGLRDLLAAGRLDPSQVYRLMRVDPGHSGQRVFVEQMLSDDRPELALRALLRTQGNQGSQGSQGSPDAASGPEVDLLLARAEAAMGRLPRALDLLLPLFEHPELSSAALDTAIRGALSARRDPNLAELLDALPESAVLESETTLETVDALLEVGQSEAALAILARLDARTETRDGGVVLRMAAARMALGEADAAAEAIERSAAWYDDGSAELGRLLLAVELGDWTALPARVAGLRALDSPRTELADVLLAALEERLDEALSLALDGELEHPEEPVWALARMGVQLLRAEPLAVPAALGVDGESDTLLALGGNATRPRDPRRLLAAVLALEHPFWTLWAERRLAAARPADPWSVLLLARVDARAARLESSAERLTKLLERRATFGPAWDLLERVLLELHGRRDHPELLKLRARRAQALNDAAIEPGSDSTSPDGGADAARVERLTVQAQLQLERGDATKAGKFLNAALQLAPDDLGALQLSAQVLAARGDWEAAATQFQRFLQLVEPLERELQLPDQVQLIERGAALGALPFSRARELLSELELLLPEAPLLPAAQARLDLLESPESPRLAAVRAFARLEQFRERTGGRSLESLAPGSASSWIGVLARLDPLEAERLARSELEAHPREFDLWLELGQLLRDQERQPEALELFDTVLAMGPEPRVLQAVAGLLAESGTDRTRVEQLLGELSQLEDRRPNDPDLELISAQARLNAGPQTFDGGLSILESLWRGRKKLPSDLARQVSGEYGAALVRRGLNRDRQLAGRVLTERLDAAETPLERALFRALSQLARRLPLEPTDA